MDNSNLAKPLFDIENSLPISFDPEHHLNIELRDKMPMLAMMTEKLAPSAATLEALRQGAERYSLPPLPAPHWEERSIASTDDNPDVRVLVINHSNATKRRPAILYLHGGGYVIGSAKLSLHATQEIAAALDCVVVSVDYRLAPDTPFPGALNDNYSALKWLYDNAATLGVDNSRIAIMGESAGGGHAATLAIAARDRGEIPVCFQGLLYPMLDDRTGSTHSVPAHIGTLIWTATTNQFGWSSLLGVNAGSADVPAGSVPARVENLRGLPPTFIGVGSLDLFVRENTEYALRLNDAGVMTELYIAPGAYHGFDAAAPHTTIAKQFKTALRNALLSAFNRKE